MPIDTTTRPDLASVIGAHARALLLHSQERGDAETETRSHGILDALSEYDRWLDREAGRVATRAAEAAAREIEDAFFDSGPDSGPDSDARRAGVNLVLDELDRLGVSDERGGLSPVDDAARTIRRTHG